MADIRDNRSDQPLKKNDSAPDVSSNDVWTQAKGRTWTKDESLVVMLDGSNPFELVDDSKPQETELQPLIDNFQSIDSCSPDNYLTKQDLEDAAVTGSIPDTANDSVSRMSKWVDNAAAISDDENFFEWSGISPQDLSKLNTRVQGALYALGHFYDMDNIDRNGQLSRDELMKEAGRNPFMNAILTQMIDDYKEITNLSDSSESGLSRADLDESRKLGDWTIGAKDPHTNRTESKSLDFGRRTDAAFDDVDQNGNGYISRDEAREAAKIVSPLNCPQSELARTVLKYGDPLSKLIDEDEAGNGVSREDLHALGVQTNMLHLENYLRRVKPGTTMTLADVERAIEDPGLDDKYRAAFQYAREHFKELSIVNDDDSRVLSWAFMNGPSLNSAIPEIDRYIRDMRQYGFSRE